MRHARVLNDVAAQPDIAGSFGWCMFDYNTHQDFGSGDRICYHGVLDMFRNPKMAASVYAVRQSDTPVLEISSSMDIGEHPGGSHGDVFIFTNADSVRMYKNGRFLKEYTHEDSDYPALEKPPIRLDDYIGDILETDEHMSGAKARDVKEILNEVAVYGMNHLSHSAKVKAGKLMLLYHMSMNDAMGLFNRYVGDWGGTATEYRFEAVKDGQVVKTVTRGPVKSWNLELIADHTDLVEKTSYDVALIRIRAVDNNGNILPYYNDPLTLKTEGEIELIGPYTIALSGGMGGTYIKTVGREGRGLLTVRTSDGLEKKIEITTAVC